MQGETRWVFREAFEGLSRNGLLGEFDGGTWTRLFVRVFGGIPGEHCDARQVHALLCAHYLDEGEAFSASAASHRDGVFLARDLSSADAAHLTQSIRALLAPYGVEIAALPSGIGLPEIFSLIGEALADAGRAERVFWVGQGAGFLVIRADVLPYGQFSSAQEYVPAAAERTLPIVHRLLRVGIAGHRFGVSTWPELVVAQAHLSVFVNMETGATRTLTGGLPVLGVAGAEGLADVRVRQHETEDGPVSEIYDASGWCLRVRGELYDASCRGGLIVAVLILPGHVWTCVGIARGQTEQPLRLPSGHARVVGPLVVCRDLRCVHLFELGSAGVTCVTLPASGQLAVDAFLEGEQLCMLSGHDVVSVDLRGIARTARHQAAPLSLTFIPQPRAALPEPASVLFVFSTSLVAEHPVCGRVTLSRGPESPSVEKGDLVLLDDVREDVPGVIRVQAWRRVGDPERVRGSSPSARVEVSAPDIRPMSEADVAKLRRPPPRSRPDAAHLQTLASRYGFCAPALLLRLLQTAETDAVFADWMERCGFADREVRGLCEDWGADPCLLAFAGNGGGDEFALYLYPPAYHPERQPPVVLYSHESNFAEFLAADFEAFFEHWLARQLELGSIDAELADRICARLSFARVGPCARPLGDAPAYLPLEHPEPTEHEDPERRLLHAYLKNQSIDTGAALYALHAKLGWELPCAHLAPAIV